MTKFGWTRFYPMTREGQSHEALSTLFQQEGVLPEIIVDGAQEQVKGEF